MSLQKSMPRGRCAIDRSAPGPFLFLGYERSRASLGLTNVEIAARVDTAPEVVAKWR